MSKLALTDGWLFKGLRKEIGDLSLADIPAADDPVAAYSRRDKRQEALLVEYTWVETTRRLGGKGSSWPALYVPGNARPWHGIGRGERLLPTAARHKKKGDGPSPVEVVVGDEHAQRQPLFPYEPTFRALEAAAAAAGANTNTNTHDNDKDLTTATTDFHSVDLVSDADTLAAVFNFLLAADPRTTVPFRLELSTVRNTLFLTKAVSRPGRGHTNHNKPPRGNAWSPHPSPGAVPDWAADAVADAGSSPGADDARLPFSGGHWRVVRYRLGKLTCVVRGKVDFVHSNHRGPAAAAPSGEGGNGGDDGEEKAKDPLRGAVREIVRGTEANNGVDTFRTLVKSAGHGTRAGLAGVVIVRSAPSSRRGGKQQKQGAGRRGLGRRHMPALYFGRVPFVIDTAVSFPPPSASAKLPPPPPPPLRVRDAQMVSARDRFAPWEARHQAVLRRMVGLLRKLREVTRALGGGCVVVADPSNRFFSVFRPYVGRGPPVPEDVVARFWPGGEGEGEAEAVTEYESTVDSVVSELSRLSRTPSGFANWTLDMTKTTPPPETEGVGDDDTESDDEERARKRRRLNPYLIMQPMINTRGRVSNWLNNRDDAGYEPDVGHDAASDNGSGPIRPRDRASRRCGLLNGGAAVGAGYGHDGAMENDVEMEEEDDEQLEEDGDLEDDEEEDYSDGQEDSDNEEAELDREDNFDDADANETDDGAEVEEESASDWGADMSDRELFQEGSDE